MEKGKCFGVEGASGGKGRRVVRVKRDGRPRMLVFSYRDDVTS